MDRTFDFYENKWCDSRWAIALAVVILNTHCWAELRNKTVSYINPSGLWPLQWQRVQCQNNNYIFVHAHKTKPIQYDHKTLQRCNVTVYHVTSKGLRWPNCSHWLFIASSLRGGKCACMCMCVLCSQNKHMEISADMLYGNKNFWSRQSNHYLWLLWGNRKVWI